MNCPKCGSANVSYQVDSKVKHSLMWGFKGQTTTYAVCQNCGKRWKRNPFFEKPTHPVNNVGYSSVPISYGEMQDSNKYCANCGIKLNGGRFCVNCGKPIAQDTTQVSQSNQMDARKLNKEKSFNNIVIGIVLSLLLWATVMGTILIFGNLSNTAEGFIWFLLIAGMLGAIVAAAIICMKHGKK